jgi:hypothetical protein
MIAYRSLERILTILYDRAIVYRELKHLYTQERNPDKPEKKHKTMNLAG